MGLLRVGTFRAPLGEQSPIHGTFWAEKDAAYGKEDLGEKREEETEHVERLETTELEEVYPILPRRTKQKDLPFIPPHEVEERNGWGENRLWIVVNNIVLDCTSYRHRHPAGATLVEAFRGQDASWQWWTFHHSGIWSGVALNLRVGRTGGVVNKSQRPKTYIGLRGFGFQDD